VNDLYERHAEICKALAHPRRLEILHLLREGEKSVGELQGLTGLPQATVSQHLAALRRAHLVRVRQQGQSAFYALADPLIGKACDVIAEVLLRQLEKDQRLARQAVRAGASR